MSLIAKFRWFLVPSIFQAGVAFVTLPLATLILDPQDYGAYAVVTAITGLASSITCLGSSYLLAQAFSSSKPEEIRQLVSQQVVISVGLSILLAVVLVVSWRGLASYFANLALVPTGGFVLSAIGVVPTTIWAIALEVLTLDGRAKVFAQVAMGQSLFSAAVLLFSLFVLDIGAMSLFVSAFIGAITLGLGAMLSLRHYLEWPCFNRKVLQLFKSALTLTGANFIEVAYQPLERNLLAVNSGLNSVGLYVHAQQYRTIVAAGTKALSRSVWPTTLEEARHPTLTFPQTNRYWRFAYLCLSVIGLGFAALGDAFIGLLTHGKFVGAGAYAAMGIAYLLVQNSGRPPTGFMYARGDVAPFARFSIISSVVALVCAAMTIPLLGVWGAMLSIFLQQAVLRVAIQWYSFKLSKLPFQDAMAFAGLCSICLLVLLNGQLELILPWQIGGFIICAMLVVGIYRFLDWREHRGQAV